MLTTALDVVTMKLQMAEERLAAAHKDVRDAKARVMEADKEHRRMLAEYYAVKVASDVTEADQLTPTTLQPASNQ
jgi:DNA primase catalytic subunit